MNILTNLKKLYRTKYLNQWKKFYIKKIVLKLTDMGLKNINLSLSTLCGANCIYCPKTRGKEKGIHNMPIDTVRKIVDEVVSEEFKENHNVKMFSVGENGDALLNPDFIEILRYIKQSIPTVLVSLNTNFRNFTKEKSSIIIKERLIDEITVNIDGHDEQSYFKVKGMSYKMIEKNILDFIDIRKENNSKIRIQVICLTFANYSKKIHDKFGKYPIAIKNDIDPTELVDDFNLISEIWKPRLDPKLDTLTQSNGVHAWSERNTIKELNHNPSNYKCPNISRINNECFIAPNGNWYGCCFDDIQKFVLGNVIEEKINIIYFNKKRKSFLKLIKNKEYEKIGYPCIFVEGCQSIE